MPSDEDLLLSGDPEDFGLFYDRYVDMLLGYFARRVHDPEVAADLTAETFAAALAVAPALPPQPRRPAVAWLFGIAQHKLADYRRRGAAEDRMRRRLGIERVPVGEDDREMIAMLGRDAAWQLIDELPPEQREAVRAHVLDDRPYAEIAAAADTSEAVVRKRVSRGLGALRQRMGARDERLRHRPARGARRRRRARAQPPAAALCTRQPAPRARRRRGGRDGADRAARRRRAEPAGRRTTSARRRDAEARGARPVRRHAPAGRRATARAPSSPRCRSRWPTATGRPATPTQPDVLILDHGEPYFDPATASAARPAASGSPRVLQVYDPAVRGLAASLTPAPADLHGWMRAHPDLRVGAARAGDRGRRARRALRRRGALPPAGPRRSALPRARSR